MSNHQKTESQFYVRGKVQGVFFRKTYVSFLKEKNLEGGATNNREDRNQVFCTAIGEPNSISKLQEFLKTEGKLNPLGAFVEELVIENHGIDWRNHDATTNH